MSHSLLAFEFLSGLDVSPCELGSSIRGRGCQRAGPSQDGWNRTEPRSFQILTNPSDFKTHNLDNGSTGFIKPSSKWVSPAHLLPLICSGICGWNKTKILLDYREAREQGLEVCQGTPTILSSFLLKRENIFPCYYS